MMVSPLRPVALALALSGCLVGPDYVRPEVPLNAAWSGQGDARLATQTPADAAWWKAFNDPTLDQLIELAYRQNLPLQIAGVRILEARAQLGVAVGEQYPTNQNPIASGGGGGIHNDKLNLYYGEFQVGFDAAWEIDFWGKYRRGVRSAKAGFLASVADYDQALVALTAEVARTYLTFRTYETLIDLAQKNVAVQEEGQRIADARFRNGATSELDVAQATALTESTRTSIPELQAGWQQAENALTTLLGQAPGSLRALLAAPRGIPAPPAQVGISVPAELLRRRPDIRGAELRAMAACDQIGVAKADLYPKFVLTGAIGTQSVGTSGAPSALSGLFSVFPLGSLIYSIGAGLFWPILNYPKILNQVRVRDARYQQTLFDYQNTVIKAQQEVEDGIAGFLREEEAALFAARAVTAAQNAVRLALVQYREGAVDYTRVLDAQRALLSSENSLAQARSAAATGLVALYKALGGGWEVRRGEASVSESTRAQMKKRTNWGGYLNR